MRLHHQDFGGEGKPPVLLLHGLLGSSRNWVTVGRLLAESFHVLALDLRNHGKSPHDDQMDYPIMGQDVLDWMQAQSLESAHIVGHSMGGKVAMWIACNHAEKLDSLTIADIAPKSYAPHFRVAFDGMQGVDPSRYNRIAEVEKALTTYVDDPVLRQFIVTNLIRNDAGTFNWQVHLDGITDALETLSANPLTESMQYNGPCQLLYGQNSNFVEPKDWPQIQHHFPSCTLTEVPNSGHNVHVENRHFFAEQMIQMIEK